MALALEVLSGSRAGDRPHYEQSVIAVGRHPSSDLQFDPNTDLLVSARHAEIRELGGRCSIRDLGSRNGTFVNGQRIHAETELHDGDEVRFGADGPQVIVRQVASVPRTSAAMAPERASAGAPPPPAGGAASAASRPASAEPRTTSPSTDERVRVAVRRHTKGMRRAFAGIVVVLAAGVLTAYWLGQRGSRRELLELRELLARSDTEAMRLNDELARLGDTAFASAMRQRIDLLRRRVNGAGSAADLAATRQAIVDARSAQRGVEAMNIPRINARNEAAVAFLASELEGKPFGSTAFGIAPRGLLVTNRHNVVAEDGSPATRIVVAFANTATLLPAHVVALSRDDSVDLALVQIDEPGSYPTVGGIAASTAPLLPGAPLVAIGYPHSLDAPMAGDTLKTSLSVGVVGKHLPRLLQIDAYASHGSSGSPIFDSRGLVVGVVYGGERDSGGRIVYAVPSEAIVKLLPVTERGIVR